MSIHEQKWAADKIKDWAPIIFGITVVFAIIYVIAGFVGWLNYREQIEYISDRYIAEVRTLYLYPALMKFVYAAVAIIVGKLVEIIMQGFAAVIYSLVDIAVNTLDDDEE